MDKQFYIEDRPAKTAGKYHGASISEKGPIKRHKAFIEIWRNDLNEALELAEFVMVAVEMYYETK